jgi:uncharacterized protein with ATP-grasp and redox domains
MGHRIHSIVRQELGNGDPYREAKEISTREALSLYPQLKSMVEDADDPLEMAVRLGIAGNIIDLGVTRTYNLNAEIERVLTQPFAIGDLEYFRTSLRQVDEVLFLADNTGETVFDRLLIETMALPVTYVVKGGPVINDATREDALAAGLDEITHIIDNGSNAPGTILDLCSTEFRAHFDSASMIIAKGQANYESLSNLGAPIFFILQTKCPIVATNLGVPLGSMILKRENGVTLGN